MKVKVEVALSLPLHEAYNNSSCKSSFLAVTWIAQHLVSLHALR
jgi:hypothetical protein